MARLWNVLVSKITPEALKPLPFVPFVLMSEVRKCATAAEWAWH